MLSYFPRNLYFLDALSQLVYWFHGSPFQITVPAHWWFYPALVTWGVVESHLSFEEACVSLTDALSQSDSLQTSYFWVLPAGGGKLFSAINFSPSAHTDGHNPCSKSLSSWALSKSSFKFPSNSMACCKSNTDHYNCLETILSSSKIFLESIKHMGSFGYIFSMI